MKRGPHAPLEKVAAGAVTFTLASADPKSLSRCRSACAEAAKRQPGAAERVRPAVGHMAELKTHIPVCHSLAVRRDGRLEDVELPALLLGDDERRVAGDGHPVGGAPSDGLAGHDGHSRAQLAEAQRVLALACRAETGLVGCGLQRVTQKECCRRCARRQPGPHVSRRCAMCHDALAMPGGWLGGVGAAAMQLAVLRSACRPHQQLNRKQGVLLPGAGAAASCLSHCYGGRWQRSTMLKLLHRAGAWRSGPLQPHRSPPGPQLPLHQPRAERQRPRHSTGWLGPQCCGTRSGWRSC